MKKTNMTGCCGMLIWSLLLGGMMSTAAGWAQGIIPIGQVQGSVADGVKAAAHTTPMDKQTVTVQGVITQMLVTERRDGQKDYGFFVQNTVEQSDDDPNSSDGIFIYQSKYPNVRIDGQKGQYYDPVVGDEIVIKGKANEWHQLTQLSNTFLVSKVRSGVDLDKELKDLSAQPPNELTETGVYWERIEGMRVHIEAGAQVVGTLNQYGEAYLMLASNPLMQRENPYERRFFRDTHPLDNDPQLFDDGNGSRVMIHSLGVMGQSGGKLRALPESARCLDLVSHSATGVVYFAYNKYSVLVAQPLEVTTGPDPSENKPPQEPRRDEEFSIASFNVENLYDYRDDTGDPCDFAGNPGAPEVKPPFNYVPASQVEYEVRLGELAGQVVQDLHAPDLLLIEELEDQDIGAVVDGKFEAGQGNGQIDGLEELAQAIKAAGGPEYKTACDRDGTDIRGIICGFLYRADRVDLPAAAEGDALQSAAPKLVYAGKAFDYNTQVSNPKALNAYLPKGVDRSGGTEGEEVFKRSPQVARALLWREGVGEGEPVELYAIVNHFASRPDARVTTRKEQAAFNAALVKAIQEANPQALVICGGDLNVFPRPDEPFTPQEAQYPSDQLAALYDAGLENLYDTILAQAPAAAYSYVYEGQAQTLDQLFVTPALKARLVQARVAHINSDWPADYHGDGPRGTSDHDPLVARFKFEQ